MTAVPVHAKTEARVWMDVLATAVCVHLITQAQIANTFLVIFDLKLAMHAIYRVAIFVVL